MITNLIWDVGGTMFDTYPATTAAFLSALEDEGIRAPAEWVRALARVSQQHCAETLAQTYHLDYDRLWARYRAYLKDAPPEQQPPFPGVVEACQAVIAAGGGNFIATHRERELVERLLRHHRLDELIAGVRCTSDGFPRKPDPAMLDDLARSFALDRDRTLVLGDREIDVLAGQAAGMRACLFGDAQLSFTPECRLEHYRDLLTMIKVA